MDIDLQGKVYVVEDFDIRVWATGEVWVTPAHSREPIEVEPSKELLQELWDGESEEAFLRLLTEYCGYDVEDFDDEDEDE